MFAYVKRYVPEAIIVLQTATFSNRIRGYISCPQFSLQFSPFSLCCTSSSLHFSSPVQFPCTSSTVSLSLCFSHFQSVDSRSVPVWFFFGTVSEMPRQ